MHFTGTKKLDESRHRILMQIQFLDREDIDRETGVPDHVGEPVNLSSPRSLKVEGGELDHGLRFAHDTHSRAESMVLSRRAGSIPWFRVFASLRTLWIWSRAHVPAGNLSIRPTSGEASRPPFASFALLLLIILTRKVIRLDGLRLQLPLHLDVKASRDTRGWA